MKDLEFIKGKMVNGLVYVGFEGYELSNDSESIKNLPREVLSCHHCNTRQLYPVTIVSRNRNKKVLYRCHKCGNIETRTYIPPKREYKPLTTEEKKRIELREKGVAEEDIIEYCNIYREDFRKQDKLNAQRKKENRQNFFHPTAEGTTKSILRMKGLDEEEIEAICELKKDEFAREDRIERIRIKNEEAAWKASFEEEERNKKSNDFKTRLDSGEIVFVKKQRAFIEVATGKVVRKL